MCVRARACIHITNDSTVQYIEIKSFKFRINNKAKSHAQR